MKASYARLRLRLQQQRIRRAMTCMYCGKIHLPAKDRAWTASSK